MVSLLIRLLALIGLLWTGKQVIHQVTSAIRPDQTSHANGSEEEREGEMVYDPMCQTYIPKSMAIQKTIHGKQVFFCGHECAEKFLAQQEQSERT